MVWSIDSNKQKNSEVCSVTVPIHPMMNWRIILNIQWPKRTGEKSIFVTENFTPQLALKMNVTNWLRRLKNLRIFLRKRINTFIEKPCSPSSVAKKTVEMAKMAGNGLNDL